MPSLDTTVSPVLFLVSSGIALISLFIAIFASVGQARLKKRFKKWKNIHSSADLEEVYQQTLSAVERVTAQLEDVQAQTNLIRTEMESKISTARIVRYNAFNNVGSDLSYSVALLDNNQNGVVLSGIYGRDETRTYAKPIEHGDSTYPLTEEELAVVTGEIPRRVESRRLVHS